MAQVSRAQGPECKPQYHKKKCKRTLKVLYAFFCLEKLDLRKGISNESTETQIK
jgi:hypothetical protein